jgi:fatty-acyl-CoA synthase
MVMGVLGAVSKGAAIVFPGEAFDAEQTLDTLAKEKCTALYGVPTMFVAMLQELNKRSRDLSTLRTGIMAGAPCPVEVMKKVNNQMNMSEVTICYGMTETAPVSFQSFVDDSIDKRCETVGRVHPHLEVKIVDGLGEIVSVGTAGEVCTRGYSVMKGYWNDIERTNDVIHDGWMHTGDLATFDQEGFCTITGRLKDMIIRGGENIYPREIEEFLFSHPKVREVQVFGVPDKKMGEEVCAWIVPIAGCHVEEDELISAAQQLAKRWSSWGAHSKESIKHLLDVQSINDFETHLKHERTLIEAAGQTAEFKEGVSAFLEKREAKFN